MHAVPANTRFTSYRATISIGNLYQVALLRQLTFLAGGGYAQYQTLTAPETSFISGFGYSIGLQNYYYTNPFRLAGTIQATRWPGYWQWQARLAHPFNHGFKAGLDFNQLQSYTELTASVSYEFD